MNYFYIKDISAPPSSDLRDGSVQLNIESNKSSNIVEGVRLDEYKLDFIDVEGREPWNEEEELNMIIAHYKYKNKWSDISSVLKGRSNNTVKNRFYSLFRRIRRKIQKGDYKYNSKLELLKIYYILSLIEEYLQHPGENTKTKGKRGKDFIYSLVCNIAPQIVNSYKERIQSIARHEGTMEELFTQLIAKGRCASAFKNSIFQVAVDKVLEESKGKDYTGKANKEQDEEIFIKQLKFLDFENSSAFEVDVKSPRSNLSSPLISAGAATVTARAYKAPCFNDIGFSDVSAVARKFSTEEKQEPLYEPFAFSEYNTEGNINQSNNNELLSDFLSTNCY